MYFYHCSAHTGNWSFSIIRLVMPLFRAVFNKYDALNNSVQENIKGIRVVKSYVREEYEKRSLTVQQKMYAVILPVQKRSLHLTIH